MLRREVEDPAAPQIEDVNWGEFIVVFICLAIFGGGWLLPLWIAAGCP